MIVSLTDDSLVLGILVADFQTVVYLPKYFLADSFPSIYTAVYLK